MNFKPKPSTIKYTSFLHITAKSQYTPKQQSTFNHNHGSTFMRLIRNSCSRWIVFFFANLSNCSRSTKVHQCGEFSSELSLCFPLPSKQIGKGNGVGPFIKFKSLFPSPHLLHNFTYILHTTYIISISRTFLESFFQVKLRVKCHLTF